MGSGYLPFRDDGIPEIQDLNVLSRFRRQHIATALMSAAEPHLIMNPEAVLRWHRDVARRRWAAKSRHNRPGRRR
jgi:ribosomal protein S18 acetylase RimI-like enzyme